MNDQRPATLMRETIRHRDWMFRHLPPRQYALDRIAARRCSVSVEQLRNDHAAGRLPRGAARDLEGIGLRFDLDLVETHYASKAGEAMTA